MVTEQELAAIPMFANCSQTTLSKLSRAMADIRLNTGEFVVHEGESPALFIVIEGLFEVVKLIDGIERTIGKRAPGQIFGEIPIIYGTQFQASYRATAPSHVLKLDGPGYYAVAAEEQKLAKFVGDMARERIGGLQGIAAEPRKSRVVLVGSRWDNSSLELRRFLERNQITYEWLAPDDPGLAGRWSGPLPAAAECPQLSLADGRILVRPEAKELAELLGLQTKPRLAEYDTVIIGGGPSGLAAAVYGASEGLSTLVVECEAPGGQAETSSRIENYLGFPAGISGAELAARALRQAKRLGAEVIVSRRVTRIDPATRLVHFEDGESLRARTVIIATGVSWRRLTIDGFDRLIGKGIFYGAARSEASITHGLDVHLIGAGNSAGQAAMFFANHARSVTLIVRGSALEKSMSQYLIDQIRGKSNIVVALGTEVGAVHGDTNLTAIDLVERRTGKARRVDSGALFVFIGADAETEWLPAEIARDKRGFILTGSDLVRGNLWHEDRDPYLVETSVPGMFACGDVRFSPVKRVASAVGEGSIAIAFVHQYLADQAKPKEDSD